MGKTSAACSEIMISTRAYLIAVSLLTACGGHARESASSAAGSPNAGGSSAASNDADASTGTSGAGALGDAGSADLGAGGANAPSGGGAQGGGGANAGAGGFETRANSLPVFELRGARFDFINAPTDFLTPGSGRFGVLEFQAVDQLICDARAVIRGERQCVLEDTGGVSHSSILHYDVSSGQGAAHPD
jgi:hypothetical protein